MDRIDVKKIFTSGFWNFSVWLHKLGIKSSSDVLYGVFDGYGRRRFRGRAKLGHRHIVRNSICFSNLQDLAAQDSGLRTHEWPKRKRKGKEKEKKRKRKGKEKEKKRTGIFIEKQKVPEKGKKRGKKRERKGHAFIEKVPDTFFRIANRRM